MYSVKEIYTTLQGEGAQTGRAAVFLRFAGCNLWSGLEADREKSICTFCDTDFVGVDGPGGGKFPDAEMLASAVASAWAAMTLRAFGPVPRPGLTPGQAGQMTGASVQRQEGLLQAPFGLQSETGHPKDPRSKPYVVCTGGEPLLQLDAALIEALHSHGFEIAIETNGTKAAPPDIDWICVSPKSKAPIVLKEGSELKLVYPQADAPPELFERLAFQYFFLQPMDGTDQNANIEAAARYCLSHPQWRLSLQTHKLIGLP